VTWAEWNDVIDVNLKGSFFLSTAFARHCRSHGRGGAVVSLASTHGLTGIAGRSVYGISKGGIIQMTRMLAIEWAPLGIRVNAVAPATVLTPSREKLLGDPEARARMLARIPLGRFPTMDEIAAAVCYPRQRCRRFDYRPDPGARWRPDGGVRPPTPSAGSVHMVKPAVGRYFLLDAGQQIRPRRRTCRSPHSPAA
jgi:NAD(P)-dependent dehydrogenase (short-subunit alcohol dehydrogenase family)